MFLHTKSMNLGGMQKSPPLDLSSLIERIVERGLNGLPIEVQLAGFAEFFNKVGFPMKWASIDMRTLHPQFGSLSYTWRPNKDQIEYNPQGRTAQEYRASRHSPMDYLFESKESVQHHRLDGGN